MTRVRFKVAAKDMEDRNAPRRPVDEVLGVRGGGSPYGSTTYKTWRLCPREHALGKVVGLRPHREAEPLAIGLIFHAALEAYYRALWEGHREEPPHGESALQEYCFGAANRAENAALDVVDLFSKEPGYRATHYDAERVVSAYLEHYRRQDLWRVLAVEETLIYEEELRPPVALVEGYSSHFGYSTRLDVLVHDLRPGRGVWAVEHKTAKLINEDLVHSYQLDIQTLGQHWLIERCVDHRALPAVFKGVLVNIATKAKTPRFERVEVCASNAHLYAFEDAVRRWSVMHDLFAWAGYPQALGSCAGALRGYSRCDFYDLCHRHPEKRVEDLLKESAPAGYVKKGDV